MESHLIWRMDWLSQLTFSIVITQINSSRIVLPQNKMDYSHLHKWINNSHTKAVYRNLSLCLPKELDLWTNLMLEMQFNLLINYPIWEKKHHLIKLMFRTLIYRTLMGKITEIPTQLKNRQVKYLKLVLVLKNPLILHRVIITWIRIHNSKGWPAPIAEMCM